MGIIIIIIIIIDPMTISDWKMRFVLVGSK